MRSHWQYLGHVEPVLPTPRTGGESQWRPLLPDLPKRAPFVVALIASVCTFVPVLSAAPPPTVDKWGPSLRTPVRHSARVVDPLTGAERPLTFVRSQHMTWQVPLSEPRRDRQRAVTFNTGAEESLHVVRSRHMTWQVPLSEPRRERARTVSYATGAERSIPAARADFTLRWNVPMSEPVRVRPRAVTFNTGAERPVEFALVSTFQVWWVKSNFLLNRRSPKQS